MLDIHLPYLSAESYDALVHADTSGNTYELVAQSCWVNVGTLTIWIRDIDAGVKIEVYSDGKEHDQPLNEIMTYYQEADEDDAA